jgi:enoyl-CoA hydratase
MPITLSFQEEFAILTIDRQEALNALSFSLIDEIGQCLDQVEKSDARALLITGAGQKAFCAGADIGELMDRDLEAQQRGAEFGQRIFSRLDTLPIASVAIINGFAFGGGLELALACTFRLATAGAKMGLPEVKLGLIPGYGGTQRLSRAIGEARAMELVLTGRAVSAEEALQLGLLNRLIEGDPVEAGMAFAREFTRHSLVALRLARKAVQRSLQTSLSEGLKIEADLSTLAYQTADSVEGMRAFLEKRKPKFTDK